MTIDEFIADVAKRDRPRNPMARIQTMASELAEGAANQLWPITFDGMAFFNEGRLANRPSEQRMQRYIEQRWELDADALGQLFNLLVANGYLIHAREPERFVLDYTITKDAFDLLHTAETATIFISYKRNESSAFALLVANVLQHAGLEAFVDMQLIPGEEWKAELQRKVEDANYLVLLLGKTTLDSKVTCKEIEWAIEAETVILPIWHNAFVYRPSDWPSLPQAVREKLASAHAIRVTEENPLAYNTAMTELLNRFGITL